MQMNKTTAEDRASITSPNPADRAAPVARAIIETGTVPRDASSYWRSHFTHAYGTVPRDIVKALSLSSSATWSDVGNALDDLLTPRPKGQPLSGWSDGSASDARAQREADRKAVRHASAPLDIMPPPAPYNSNSGASS